jgi:hypothetical protein
MYVFFLHIFTFVICPACSQTEKLGGKLVLGVPLFTAGLLSFLTPVAAKELGYGAVIALRILIGMCEVSSTCRTAQYAPNCDKSFNLV